MHEDGRKDKPWIPVYANPAAKINPTPYRYAVPVRRQDQVTLTLDKQIARAILRKLQDIAEDAEESLQIAKKFNNAHVAEYEAYMSKARKQYTSFYRALQEAQS